MTFSRCYVFWSNSHKEIEDPLKIKRALASGATTLGLVAAGLMVAAPAQADTIEFKRNEKAACETETKHRVQHLRSQGYTVSVQQRCKGIQYIGFMPQYYTTIVYN